MRRLPRTAAWSALLMIGAGVVAGLTGATGSAVADDRRSGFDFMSAATQALQRDDSLNPAMLWVQGGAAAWSAKAGRADKACADCHAPPAESMRGVAARHPAFDAAAGAPLTLSGRINACRTRHQQAPALAAESDTLLGLEAHIAMASRGLPITPPDDARLTPFRDQGRRLFELRIGQLDLSCAQCHDRLAGQRLGGSPIPQGHTTAYPIYRLEWQGLGSLQRRLRNCLAGVRAEVLPYGHADLVALELHLMQRAAGLRLESPGVRP